MWDESVTNMSGLKISDLELEQETTECVILVSGPDQQI